MKKKLILAASVAIVAAAAASCGTKDIKYDTSLDVKEVHLSRNRCLHLPKE